MSGLARRVCLVLCVIAASAGQASAADWTYAASEHFEVYTTGGSRRAREALTYFERVHAFFADFLKLSPKTTTRTCLIVFSNEGEFRPYRFNDVAVAYYHQGDSRDYIVMQELGVEASAIVVHEYAHLVMTHSGRRYPLWLYEGYAEFLSTLSPSGGRMSIGRVPEGRLQYLRSAERLFDLPRLFAISQESPEYRTGNHAGMFYSQSWALTHMLVTDERYRGSFDRFVVMLGEGASSEAALTQAFGRSIVDISADLVRYVQRQRFGFVTAGDEPPPAGAAYAERAVSAFEARLVAARLLASAGGAQDRARAAFDALEQERADDLSLLEARALFELRNGQRDGARPYLARAVALGSTNARIYREYALLPGTEPATVEPLLGRALELQPDDLESRIRLASLFLRRKQAAETLAVLAPAQVVPPERVFDVAQLRANAHLELKNAHAARASAGAESESARSARALAPDPANNRVSLDGHALLFATGRLRNVICSSTPAIEVDTADGSLTLVIDAPKMIRVFGTGTTEADLACGWHDRRIRVGYYRPVRAGRAAGNLRVLDYR